MHVSNALGTINPVADIIRMAHDIGAKTLIDGAQSVAHWDIDVQALDADFFAFSGHKLFAPTGIGALYGKKALLDAMPPYQTGGEMIEHVSFAKTTFNTLPYKFEAGTPHISGAIGLAAAIDFLNGLDRAALAAHEDALMARVAELPKKMAVSVPLVTQHIKPASSASCWKALIRQTSAHCLTNKVLQCVPDTIVLCRLWTNIKYRVPSGRLSLSTIRWKKWMLCLKGWKKPKCFYCEGERI